MLLFILYQNPIFRFAFIEHAVQQIQTNRKPGTNPQYLDMSKCRTAHVFCDLFQISAQQSEAWL